MNLAALHPGAVVECNVRGRTFEASVTGTVSGRFVDVAPPAGVTYRRLRPHQVKRVVSPPQLQLGGES